MVDLIYLAVTITFFAIALGYTWFWGSLRKGVKRDEY